MDSGEAAIGLVAFALVLLLISIHGVGGTDTATPTPTANPTPTATETPSPSATPSPTPSPTPTPTATPSPTPEPSDPDKDNLPSKYEKRIGTNPQRMTILVSVIHSHDSRRLSDEDKNEVKRRFSEMKVLNPDGSAGIDVLFVEESPFGVSIEANEEYIRQLIESYPEGDTPAEFCREHYVYMTRSGGEAWGIAHTGGWVSIVETGDYTNARLDIMVHELLHNVVGEFDQSKDAVVDGNHVKNGWLQPGEVPGGPYRLHDLSQEKLQSNGFANDYSNREGCL
jgi:hypothetical protein